MIFAYEPESMNLRATLCVFCFLLSNFYFTSPADAAPPSDLRAFFGEVKTISLAAKTITIQLGKTFAFHVTDQTRISAATGGALPFDKIRPGQGALVTVRPGPGNTGIAVNILITPGGTFANDYSARTTKGETISGAAIDSYVVSKPPPDDINRNINFGMYRSGLFLLSVAPDGTVPDVKVLRTLGYEELDVRAVKWLKKWRFRPNSLSEVRMPMNYHRTR
jgi:TonB family protein